MWQHYDQWLTELVRLRYAWEEAKGELAAQAPLVEALANSPEPPTAVHAQFVDTIRRAVAARAISGFAPAPPRSPSQNTAARRPIRNPVRDTPSHVELFDEHQGLVHGGIVRVGRSVLRVKAYRLFEHRAEIHFKRDNHKFAERSQPVVTDIVAAVVDHETVDSRVVETWTTAARLEDFYGSTRFALPPGACRMRFDGRHFRNFGFYRPALAIEALQGLIKKGQNDTFLDLPEGELDETLYRRANEEWASFAMVLDPRSVPRHFNLPPAPELALENPLFVPADQGATTTEGFVIATPYVSVFAPSPQLPAAVVSTVGIYRQTSFRGLGRRAAKGLGELVRIVRWEPTDHERNDPGIQVRSFAM